MPLLTRSGQTFASRVAGSILTAIGAEELIVTNEDDYFQLALRIYKDKEYLGHLKQIVKSGIDKGPLYDIQKYTSNFEKALMNSHSISIGEKAMTDIHI